MAEAFRGVSHHKLVELANDYCTTYKTNLSGIPIENAVQVLTKHIVNKVDIFSITFADYEMGILSHNVRICCPLVKLCPFQLKSDFQNMEMGPRRMMASPQVQAPPGAAPGYMSMGLLGVDARPSSNQAVSIVLYR